MIKPTKKQNTYTKSRKEQDNRTCRCKLCGREIYRSNCYSIHRGLTTELYCSRQEYIGGQKYINEINQYEPKILAMVLYILDVDSLNQIDFNNEFIDWLSRGSPKKIYGYLFEKQENFRCYIKNKNIERVTPRFHYLSAIIKNNLIDYKIREDGGIDDPTPIMNMATDIDIDMYEVKREPRRNIRRSLADLEDEL